MNLGRRVQRICGTDCLVHVLPSIRPSGCSTTVLGAISGLPRYTHCVVHETPLTSLDEDELLVFQGSGADLRHSDQLSESDLIQAGSLAIFYDPAAPHYAGLGKVLPSVHYAYHQYLSSLEADIVVACSDYAHVKLGCPSPKFVLPPFLDMRGLRRTAGPASEYAVGLLSSANRGKYPYDLVKAMLRRFTGGGRFLVTSPPDQDDELTRLMRHEARLATVRLYDCPVKITAGVQFAARADTLVYGTAPGFEEPCGKLVLEAMGLGKAVVCERKGVFVQMLRHGVDALLYDTPEEAVDYTMQLREDTALRARLGANAQLTASGYDYQLHMPMFKTILRELGI